MIKPLYIRCIFCCVILMIFGGCVVLRPVGHAISQGYENTVSYFNGYYNATWLFSEAEDEIEADTLAKRGIPVQSAAQYQIPPATREKLNKVIDKCSNILAFHSSSTLVDDALFIIGKSFYYQAEYLKAERKFAELLAQYPESPLILEAQIWLARTEKQLEKNDEGIQICDSTIAAAQKEGELEIEMYARQQLADFYLAENQPEKARIEYEKSIALAADEVYKAGMQLRLGNIYFSNGEYKEAAEIYRSIGGSLSDRYLQFYSGLQSAIAYRKCRHYEEGIALLDRMIQNFRYKAYLPELLVERANNYAESGKKKEAIDEYTFIDTTYEKTESAAEADSRLGAIYEKENGDYSSALKYYTKSKSAQQTALAKESQLKYEALTRYFKSHEQIRIIDSIFVVLSDTTRMTEGEIPGALTSDSVRLPSKNSLVNADSLRKDSLKIYTAIRDSLQKKISQGTTRFSSLHADTLKALQSLLDVYKKKISQMSMEHLRLNPDSLIEVKAFAAEELGDVFYSELNIPDSAFYWYETSLAWKYHQVRSPRILYILAELSRNQSGIDSSSSGYSTRLIRDFPESIYAEETQRFLGKSVRKRTIDTAETYYVQAEKLIETKQYKNAMHVLRTLAVQYPKSPYAAKSEFTMGWIYEHHLRQADSAMAHYGRVVKNHGSTKYAQAAAHKSLAGHLDTVKTAPVSVSAGKTDSLRSNSSKIDTGNVQTQKKGLLNTSDREDTVRIKSGDSGDLKKDLLQIDTAKGRSFILTEPGSGGAPRDSLKRDTLEIELPSRKEQARKIKQSGGSGKDTVTIGK